MNTTRCESMSKRGRCKRMTKDSSKKCHQHRVTQSDSDVSNTTQVAIDEHEEVIPPSEPRIVYINIDDDDDHYTEEAEDPVPVETQASVDSQAFVDLIAEMPISEQLVSNQCEGKTRSGNQCARMTLNVSKRCHLHQETTQPRTVQALNASVARLQEQVRQIETLARTRLQQLTNNHQTHKEPRPKRNKDKKEQPKDRKNSCGKTEECCVCYEPVPEDEFLECDHAVCKSCIGQLRDTRCPMCRAEIKSKNISESQKKKMVRRRIEDQTNRNNQLVQQYMELVNQTENPAYSNFRLDF